MWQTPEDARASNGCTRPDVQELEEQPRDCAVRLSDDDAICLHELDEVSQRRCTQGDTQIFMCLPKSFGTEIEL